MISFALIFLNVEIFVGNSSPELKEFLTEMYEVIIDMDEKDKYWKITRQ